MGLEIGFVVSERWVGFEEVEEVYARLDGEIFVRENKVGNVGIEVGN